jgi:hypothetical protein
MQPSPFDFVSALSAEEGCPVCNELHAAVDQCVCAACQTTMCRDCASLRPDTSWVCVLCAVRVPPVAVAAFRPTHLRLRERRIALVAQLTEGTRQGLQRVASRYRGTHRVLR